MKYKKIFIKIYISLIFIIESNIIEEVQVRYFLPIFILLFYIFNFKYFQKINFDNKILFLVLYMANINMLNGIFNTYAIPKLIAHLIENDLYMVTIVCKAGEYRKWHSLGNKMITGFAKSLFGKNVNDILSGYRIFSKKFVKTFPASSKCFEIESELTIFALQMRLPIGEMDAEYKSRTEGSFSKLNTFRDGFRIIKAYHIFAYE